VALKLNLDNLPGSKGNKRGIGAVVGDYSGKINNIKNITKI
jgi:hypothetical protein